MYLRIRSGRRDSFISVGGSLTKALYLRDLDGNGVELYWDRPEDQWPRSKDGSIEMFMRRLDLHALLSAVPAAQPDNASGKVGHG
jgi:catechol-2,3-dioxygenase